MATNALLADELTRNLGMLTWHLNDFSDADMLARPLPTANHAAWQVGHLLAFEVMCCGLYAPQAPVPKLPEDAKTLYGKEGAKLDDASKFLKKDELIKGFTQTNEALSAWVRGMSEADLAKPAPEKFKGWVSTIGELVLGIMGHRTMHVGQIQVIRRKLGKPVLF